LTELLENLSIVIGCYRLKLYKNCLDQVIQSELFFFFNIDFKTFPNEYHKLNHQISLNGLAPDYFKVKKYLTLSHIYFLKEGYLSHAESPLICSM